MAHGCFGIGLVGLALLGRLLALDGGRSSDSGGTGGNALPIVCGLVLLLVLRLHVLMMLDSRWWCCG